MAVTTLVGADDPDRAPVAELRDVFTPADGIICETLEGRWFPLWSWRFDFESQPVRWEQGQ